MMNPWTAYNYILTEISDVCSAIASQTGLPSASMPYQFAVINRPAYSVVGNKHYFLLDIPKTNNLMTNHRALAISIQNEINKRWLFGNSLAPFHINVVQIVGQGSQIFMDVCIL